MVTDFTFSSFEAQSEVPNFFALHPDRLEEMKSLTSNILQEKYDADEAFFYPIGIQFIGTMNPEAKLTDVPVFQRDHHRKRIKKGGYDLYLRFNSSISISAMLNDNITYHFAVDVRLSDRRGKKILVNSIKIPFKSDLNSDGISSSKLISADDFYSLMETCIQEVFKGKKKKLDLVELKRGADDRFDSFIAEASHYTLRKFRGNKPELIDASGNKTVITARSGAFDNSTESGLFSDNLEYRTKLKIRNPWLSEDWKVSVASSSKKAFGFMETEGTNAEIKIRINDKRHQFKLDYNKLSGTLNDKMYSLHLEFGSSLMKGFVGDELKVLLQPKGREQSAELNVFFAGSNQKELAAFINLHQAYLQAVYTSEEALERND